MLAHYATTVAARSELRTFATSSGIFGHLRASSGIFGMWARQRPRA